MSNWQPMETAPKDGTWVLIAGQNHAGHTEVNKAMWMKWAYDEGFFEGWFIAYSGYKAGMTQIAQSLYWMPLPDPPPELVDGDQEQVQEPDVG